MRNRELALEFVRRFCRADIQGLEPLLAEDLRFEGPFVETGTRATYLESLRASPLERTGYEISSVTEGDGRVAVFWCYEKDEGAVRIAQLFGFSAGKISEVLLVFDASVVATLGPEDEQRRP